MIRRARTDTYRFADFLELVPEHEKADLIQGVIYMASPENTEHNGLILWLGQLLGLFVAERRLGKVMINKVAYRLSDDTAPEPDLAFVRADRAGIIKRGYVDGPPDLAIEVVSPDSVTRDYDDKRLRYEEAGVHEYWIIDADERQASFLVRGDTGFVEAELDQQIFRSRTVPGFSLDVRWLWQHPLPSALTIVQQLLAG